MTKVSWSKAKLGVRMWTDNEQSITKIPLVLRGLDFFPLTQTGTSLFTAATIIINPPATIYIIFDAGKEITAEKLEQQYWSDINLENDPNYRFEAGHTNNIKVFSKKIYTELIRLEQLEGIFGVAIDEGKVRQHTFVV